MVRVRELFASRPIWSLMAVRHQLQNVSEEALLAALTRTCYRFKTGPWRTLYILRGYDPRQDRDSRPYQAITYRMPRKYYQALVEGTSPEPDQQPALGPAGGQQGLMQEGQDLGVSGGMQGQQGEEVAGEGGLAVPSTEEMHVDTMGMPVEAQLHLEVEAAQPEAVGTGLEEFMSQKSVDFDQIHRFRAVPSTRTTVFQLVDLVNNEVQKLVGELPWPQRCSEASGWFLYAGQQQLLKVLENTFSRFFQEQLDRRARGKDEARRQSEEQGGVGSASGPGGTASTLTEEAITGSGTPAAGPVHPPDLPTPLQPAHKEIQGAPLSPKHRTVLDVDDGVEQEIPGIPEAPSEGHPEEAIIAPGSDPTTPPHDGDGPSFLQSLMEQMTMQGAAEGLRGWLGTHDEYEAYEIFEADDVDGGGAGYATSGGETSGGEGGMTTDDEGFGYMSDF